MRWWSYQSLYCFSTSGVVWSLKPVPAILFMPQRPLQHLQATPEAGVCVPDTGRLWTAGRDLVLAWLGRSRWRSMVRTHRLILKPMSAIRTRNLAIRAVDDQKAYAVRLESECGTRETITQFSLMVSVAAAILGISEMASSQHSNAMYDRRDPPPSLEVDWEA
jgi:hypothetical protein